MSIYELDRIQESCAWMESIRALPPAHIGGELVVRAFEKIDDMPQGQRREDVEELTTGLFDQEVLQAFRIRRAETSFMRDIDSMLGQAALNGDSLKADCQEDKPPEEPDLFKKKLNNFFPMLSEEEIAELDIENDSRKIERIDSMLNEAEFGIEFGEQINEWNVGCTVDAIREIKRLQKELEAPIASDRLRELIVKGLNGHFFGYAAKELLVIAEETDDVMAFMAAGDKYSQAIQNKQQTESCEASLISIATKFFEKSLITSEDEDTLSIALNAVAHYDPVSSFYPIYLARLGRALQC